MAIVIRAALVYLLLLIVLRVSTRRVARTPTPLDLVLVFIFGGSAVQAVLGEDHSVTGGIIAIFSFAGTHLLISGAKLVWPAIGRVVEGSPVILFENGEWRYDWLRRTRLQRQDVLSEMRQRGIRNLDQVDIVLLEHSGSISVVSKP